MLLIDRVKISPLILIVVLSLFLMACQKENNQKKGGQALISINGKEITTLQLNDELKRSNFRIDQYEVASKQLLENLIARQLIVDEAIRTKLDRSPDVMRARERANAQVIAQFYLQELVSKIPKPSKSEIEEYFYQHPQHFGERKQFELEMIQIAKNELNDELKEFVRNVKSLNDVIFYLNKRDILFIRNEMVRSTADLPDAVVAKLLESKKDQVIIIPESEFFYLLTVNREKDSPILLDVAAPQIEKLLMNQKYKQATDSEIIRLRSLAKIEYLNLPASINNGENKIYRQPMLDPAIVNNPSLSEPSPGGLIEHGTNNVQ